MIKKISCKPKKKMEKLTFPFSCSSLQSSLLPILSDSSAMSLVFAFLPLVSVFTDDVARLHVVDKIGGDRCRCPLHVVDPCDCVSGMVLEECVVVDGAG